MVVLAALAIISTTRHEALYPADATSYHEVLQDADGLFAERRKLDGTLISGERLPKGKDAVGIDTAGNLLVRGWDEVSLLNVDSPVAKPISLMVRGSWSILEGEEAFALQRNESVIHSYPRHDILAPIGLDRLGTVSWLATDSETFIYSAEARDGKVVKKPLFIEKTEAKIRDGFPFVPLEFVDSFRIATVLRIEVPSGTRLSVPYLASGDHDSSLYLCLIERLTGRVTPVRCLNGERRDDAVQACCIDKPLDSSAAVRTMLAPVGTKTIVLHWEQKLWQIDISILRPLDEGKHAIESGSGNLLPVLGRDSRRGAGT